MSLQAFLAQPDDGSLYLGHAGVLARIGGKLWLFDPIGPARLFLDAWQTVPEPLALPDYVLACVSGVFVSHEHVDHVDLGVLRRVQCPIFIPTNRPRLRAMLDSLRVVELPHGERATLWPYGIDAICVPSDHNDVDASWVVRGPAFALYHGNDNYIAPERLDDLGPVDHAYVPSGYVHWYPFVVESMSAEERERVGAEQIRKHFDLAVAYRNVLQAKRAIAHAGGLAYVGQSEAMRAAQTTGAELEAYSSGLVEAWEPGSWATAKAEGVTKLTVDEARKRVEAVRTVKSGVDWKSRREWLGGRLRGSGRMVIVEDGRDAFWCINPDGCATKSTHAFRLADHAMAAWCDGAPFAHVLASGEFTLRRDPEVYDRELFALLGEWQ